MFWLTEHILCLSRWSLLWSSVLFVCLSSFQISQKPAIPLLTYHDLVTLRCLNQVGMQFRDTSPGFAPRYNHVSAVRMHFWDTIPGFAPRSNRISAVLGWIPWVHFWATVLEFSPWFKYWMPFWDTVPGSAFIHYCSIWCTASVTSIGLWIQWKRVPRWMLPFGPDTARCRPMASAVDFIEVGFVRFPFVFRNFIVWHMACFVVTVLEEIMFW